uniref:Uncharacterized protein n=1 Tax=Tetranychus urticae TaxID=32264 RepID=T1JRM8_TETUR
MKTLASITLGKVPIEWISGERDQNDSCHSSICSTSFLQSIQSGLVDASFPGETMEHFSLIPENMSFSSMMYPDDCGFINLYTETAVKSKYPGILNSFQIIHLNVYVLIGFLITLGVYIYLVREKSLPGPFKGTTKKLVDGQFGFIVLAICYFALYYVYELLCSSFTTNYSIQSRDEPLVYLDDLNKSTQTVTVIHDLYCALKMADNSLLSSRINTVDLQQFLSYISDHLFDDRIVFIDSANTMNNYIRIFCNFMINLKKTDEFYIHVGDQRYFYTLRLLVYHKFIEKSKELFLQRATYSCVEMGFCIDAIDRAVIVVFEKRNKFYKTCAQCKRYEQIESYPVAFHPIAFITIKDLLYLFVLLVILSGFVLIVELILSSKRDKPKAVYGWLSNILLEVAVISNIYSNHLATHILFDESSSNVRVFKWYNCQQFVELNVQKVLDEY